MALYIIKEDQPILEKRDEILEERKEKFVKDMSDDEFASTTYGRTKGNIEEKKILNYLLFCGEIFLTPTTPQIDITFFHVTMRKN